MHNNGFEIAFHNASSGSNIRERTIKGLEIFKNEFGFYPKSYANHNNNKKILYWGKERVNNQLLKLLIRFKRGEENFSQGHIIDSPYFWGDICQSYITYVRNFVYKNEINILRINKTVPYKDNTKPFVNYWFSSSDGANVYSFNRLLSEKNQEKFKKEGCICIIYKHFAKDL